MADQQKPAWLSTLPGLLTAATGFVAALSGLVAGLNQLGVFDRPEPARQEVTAAAPPERVSPEPEEHTAAEPEETVPVRTARPATPPPRAATPAPAPGSTVTAATPSTDTAAAPRASRRVLPSGTSLELVTIARACAPKSGAARVTARLAAPVTLPDGALPVTGTTAVLRLRRREATHGVEVRLDSLVRRGASVAARRSEVSVRRSGSATCLPAGTRITATLGAAVTLPAR